jgi:hypothetical protein
MTEMAVAGGSGDGNQLCDNSVYVATKREDNEIRVKSQVRVHLGRARPVTSPFFLESGTTSGGRSF